MYIRLAFQSVVRTPAKTILFLVLIGAAVASLCLGIGMWDASERLLADAERTYQTVAHIEYIGENYPDEKQFDHKMVEELSAYEDTPLREQPEVLNYNRQIVLGGTVDQLLLGNRGTAQFRDTAVFNFRVYYEREDHYICLVTGTPLFTGNGHRDGLFFKLHYNELREAGIEKEDLVIGERYFTIGRFYDDEKRNVCFRIEPCTLNVPEEYRALAERPLSHIADEKRLTEDPAYPFFYKAAETYRVLTNHLRIVADSDPKNAAQFYLEETHLVEGDFYAEDEKDVCILSEYLCEKMGLAVGDTWTVDLYATTEGRGAETSFWYDDGYLAERTYRVVGIYQNATGLYSTVFVPKSDDVAWPDRTIDYTVCRVRLQNDGVQTYLDAIAPHLLGSMRVSVYDQGYANAKEAIHSMRETAQLLTYVCAGVTLSLLILFAWLFLQKQRVSARIMRNLGTTAGKTMQYLLYSAAIVLLTASVLGGVFGSVLSERVIVNTYERALLENTLDVRFSDLAIRGKSLTEVIMPHTDVRPTAFTVLGSFLAGLLCTCGFFRSALEQYSPKREKRKQKKRKNKAEHPADTAVLLQGIQLCGTSAAMTPQTRRCSARIAFPLRIALRSIGRNRGKSILVLAVALALTGFLGFFLADLETYEERLDAVYERMPVTAQLTSFTGRHNDGLAVSNDMIAAVTDTGFVAETYRTQKVHYLLMTSGSEPVGFSVPENATGGGFAAETFMEELLSQPMLIGTNSLSASPEFYHEGDVRFSFLEGFDESDFRGEEQICLANQAFLDRNGIMVGDYVGVLIGAEIGQEGMSYAPLQLRVVGTYPAMMGRDSLYCPLSVTENSYLCCDFYPVFEQVFAYRRAVDAYERESGQVFEPELRYTDGCKQIYGPDGICYAEYTVHQKYASASFLLCNTRELSVFKDRLEEQGFRPAGQLGVVRRTVIVSEANLTESVQSIERHIRYMHALFIAFEVLSVAVGFVVSYLMTKNRRAELAVCRSLGTGKWKTFLIFLLEQSILFFLGMIAATVLLLLLFDISKTELLRSLGILALLYTAGAVLSIAWMNRMQVLEILQVKE